MDRVVVYGCSHAFGAEIEGPGIGISKINAEKNFGALIAKHFDKPLKISARLGGCNRQILFNVIEHTQPGDLCLLSWTYFGRDNWFPRSNDDHIKAEIFNEYHAAEAFYLSENLREATADRVKSGGSQLIANYNDPLVKSFSHAQIEYYQKKTVKAIEFLQIYHAANAVIKQRGANPVNIHFDCSEEILHLINGETSWPVDKIFKEDYYDEYSLSNVLLTMPETVNLKLFSDYQADENFIRFHNNSKEISFRKWVCNKLYGSTDWPSDGRSHHLGETEHQILSEIVIEKLENKK